ncbi:AIM24 family protein [Saccharomonospora viridis]|jgi:uncharacterized protein (AIM24 family)|uniref:AIM24 family protein n=1 Tax=Saccharomonospora viridis TaxID=1852 RepID=UPI0001A37746|nr:AIM24 family protein [Saccharomonospora viridis]SFP59163.1 Uncharacterized conserved protein, AIM24 family [Saccharomonospora viridis]
MRVHTRHTPQFGVARVVLSGGEAVEAHADTVLAHSFGVLRSKKGKGSEPSIFTAPAEGGWIDLAPKHPGDVYPLELSGRLGWSVAHDAVLARPATVRHDHPWPAHQSLFGGDSGFLKHFSGTGPLVLASRGPVDSLTLKAGEVLTVNPLFVLAYPDSVQVRLRALDPVEPQSIRTGAGLALDVAGPGAIFVQTRARA